MIISRPDADQIAVRAEPVALQAHTQIVVDDGDCCVVMLHGQALGKIDPGRWTLQQLPFCQQVLGAQGGGEFFYVFTRPFGPIKMGGRISGVAGVDAFTAEANVVAQDPVLYIRSVIGSSAEDGARWIQSTLSAELTQAVQVAAASTPADQLASAMDAIAQSVAQGAGTKLAPVGIGFGQLLGFNLRGQQGAAAGGAAGAAVSAAAGSSGGGKVQLLGPMAGKVTSSSPDEKTARYEGFGLFVAADPLAIRHFSGATPGWRWLARGDGSLKQHVHGWPLAPNGGTSYHFSSEEQARAYYGALRQHAMASAPGLQAQDTRESMGLNTPSSYSETLWSNGQEVFYLILDQMEDMQALAHETEGTIGIHPACPDLPNTPDLPIITYKSASDVLYVAAAPGPSGAADHVLIVLSEAHSPTPTIPEGMPRAEWMSKFEKPGIRFTGDVLVVQWGRFGGNNLLAGEDPNNPASSLKAKIGTQLGIPLQTQHEAAPRLGGHPPGYAVRMEPGTYSLNYYELSTKEHGDFSFCAISRDGAEGFLPTNVVGNAGGLVFGGLDVEQYAMLSVERDNLLMQMGAAACTSPQMAALCQKYGIAFTGDGMAGRLNEWEQYMTNNPAFSAQWATQRGIATMRLQGQEPDAQQIEAIAQQQNVVQQHLEQGVATADAIRDAAIHVIQSAAGQTPEAVLGMIQQQYSQFQAEDVLYKTLRILREPDEFGRFDNIETCVEPLARAHYRTKSPEDQKFEGSEDKFFKEEREIVYSAYDLEVPGFFSKLFG